MDAVGASPDFDPRPQPSATTQRLNPTNRDHFFRCVAILGSLSWPTYIARIGQAMVVATRGAVNVALSRWGKALRYTGLANYRNVRAAPLLIPLLLIATF